MFLHLLEPAQRRAVIGLAQSLDALEILVTLLAVEGGIVEPIAPLRPSEELAKVFGSEASRRVALVELLMIGGDREGALLSALARVFGTSSADLAALEAFALRVLALRLEGEELLAP